MAAAKDRARKRCRLAWQALGVQRCLREMLDLCVPTIRAYGREFHHGAFPIVKRRLSGVNYTLVVCCSNASWGLPADNDGDVVALLMLDSRERALILPLPFIVKNHPITGTECVACHNFRLADELTPCHCGSPICDCGIPCPDCAEISAIHEASVALYEAKHIHLVHAASTNESKPQTINTEELVRVLGHLGWLN